MIIIPLEPGFVAKSLQGSIFFKIVRGKSYYYISNVLMMCRVGSLAVFVFFVSRETIHPCFRDFFDIGLDLSLITNILVY